MPPYRVSLSIKVAQCICPYAGAGKTTLLDVLSGRKNTGVVRGDMFINGQPKEEHHFRKINVRSVINIFLV